MKKEIKINKNDERYEIIFKQNWINRLNDKIKIKIFKYKKIRNEGFEEYEEMINFESFRISEDTGKGVSDYGEEDLIEVAIKEYLKLRGKKKRIFDLK